MPINWGKPIVGSYRAEDASGDISHRSEPLPNAVVDVSGGDVSSTALTQWVKANAAGADLYVRLDAEHLTSNDVRNAVAGVVPSVTIVGAEDD